MRISFSVGFSCGGVVADSRLAAAERHADQRRLPGHLHRQAGDLVQADGRRHADAALGGPENVVVPHQEHLRVQHLAVGDLRMNRHPNLFFRLDDSAGQVRVQVQPLRGLLDVPQGGFQDGVRSVRPNVVRHASSTPHSARYLLPGFGSCSCGGSCNCSTVRRRWQRPMKRFPRATARIVPQCRTTHNGASAVSAVPRSMHSTPCTQMQQRSRCFFLHGIFLLLLR